MSTRLIDENQVITVESLQEILKNILAAGHAVLACGEVVRPARKLKSLSEGTLQRKQESWVAIPRIPWL
ncbi:MAG: hypothetical protein AAGT88_07460 [Dethiobacter sp.]